MEKTYCAKSEMTESAIKIFDVNTDAVAVNRGFYYQYLVVLKKWISNFIYENNDCIYSEVDDDIMEVGGELVFTQVKCYSSSFSFKSVEIKKTIFNYFILFLKNRHNVSTKFCFTTNSGIIKTEKLLKAWCDDPLLVDNEIRNHCLLKIKSILTSEISQRKRKKIETKNIASEATSEIKLAAEGLKKEVNDFNIGEFIKCIQWEFSSIDTNAAIDLLFREVKQLLRHKKFKNRPVSILESVLLSEIYNCSQNNEKKDRVLTNEKIISILEKTDEDLEQYIHNEFLNLINFDFEEVKQSLKELQEGQEKNNYKVDILENKVEKLQKKSMTLPKELTLIPIIFNGGLIGRDNCLNKIKDLLKCTQVVSISSGGGNGKTTLVQKYLHSNIDDFDHVVWVESAASLVNSILLNKELLTNLNIDFDQELQVFDKFKVVCNKLGNINGQNLLVIDGYEGEMESLKHLMSLSNWKIIITTRELIPNITNFKLPKLDFASILNIYNQNLDRATEDNEKTLKEFFTFVDYNPLVVELFAKTISNSLDLDLNKLLNYLQNQNLDDEELHIDLLVLEENSPVRLLSYLQKKFEYSKLSSSEIQYLEFLALLPSEDISIEDIASIGGKESYVSNKTHFTNLSNSLHQKGWVERKGGKLKMHRLVQELIIYNTRGNLSPFFSCSFLITWLIHRIDENAQCNPNKSFKYLKYAESILFSIKEQYRTSLYQPLLMLENALLNAYGWTDRSRTLHLRWQNLLERAKNCLASDDQNIAILYNNVGLSFANQDEIEESLIYFLKAVKILEKNESKSIDLLINSLNNLIQNYFTLNDIENAQKFIRRVAKLKLKYPEIDEQFNAVHYNVIGFGYQKANDLNKAIVNYEKAIKAHLSIINENRNDYYLIVYYANLIGVKFLLGEHRGVIKLLNEVAKVSKGYNLLENPFLVSIYGFLASVSAYYLKDKKRRS